jgi:hypothetical protein
LAAGLTASAFVASDAVMAANPPSWLHDTASSPTIPPTTVRAPAITAPPPTTIVVQTVHHPVYVDQYGKPVDPAAVPGATPAPSSTNTTRVGGTAPATGGGTSRSSPTSPATTAPPPVTAAPEPPPPPPAPPCSGSKC